MSTDSHAETESAGVPDPADERDVMLDLLEDGVREAHRKVESGRVYDAENEKVRQKWIRTLAYSVNIYRQTLADRELEEINERLEALEEAQGLD